MTAKEFLKAVLGALLLATMLYAVLAAPGFLSDAASTVGPDPHVATVRP